MPTRPTHSTAQRITNAQVAITNALKDAEIQKLMAGYGYTAARIKEGQKLLEAAKSSLSFHRNMAGGQQDLTAKTIRAFHAAVSAYQGLAKTARAIWLRDRAKLAALGLTGRMPTTTAGFLSAAYTLFNNAGAGEANARDLADYGYTKAKLASERGKVEAFDRANQEQEAAKGSAQVAGHSQQLALKDLDEWLARSSKTRAQRHAPTVARLTRLAKKQTAK